MIKLFDEAFPIHEQIPRRMEIILTSEPTPQGELVRTRVNGRPVGDPLADVAWFSPADDDKEDAPRCPADVTGARFHDALHLAFAACLGWSPVLRTLAGLIRRSDPSVAGQQDSAAAVRIEEEISLAVFCLAREHVPYEERPVEAELLASVRKKTSGLEVSACSDAEWAHAIGSGIACIQAMWANNGGTLTADLYTRSLVYSRPREHAGAAV